MTISPGLAVAIFFAGLILGGLNFWALHHTVKRALSSTRPARYFLLSLLLRMALLLPLSVWLVRHNPVYLLTGLLGFTLARKIVVQLTRDQKEALSVS